jgi:DNA end-binding protein Ku
MFDPKKYHDTVRERVLETIQRKIDGQDITADAAPASGTKILDLMEALKASLEKPKESKEAKPKKAAKAS